MKYEIHHDRILMREETGKTIAKIEYPEVGRDVCEIAHIYGENSAAGRENANLLMEMAVAEIKKSNRKLIPGCAFATNWFSRHPEEKDVLTDWDTLRQMEESLYGVKTKEIKPVTRENVAANEEAEQQRDSVTDDNGEDSSGRKKKRKDRKKDAAEKRAADEQAARERAEARKEQARREQEEKRQAILEDAREEEERIRKGEETLDNSLTVVLRVLQIISMLCMLGVIALFVSAAITEKIYQPDSLVQMIGLGISAVFVIFCVIQLFWIMSRKRLRDEFGDKLDERYDAGRGIFGFIIVLIVSFICGLVINFIPDAMSEILGLEPFASIYQLRIMPIVYAAIAGLVLCLIRKIAGRQMVR